MPHSTHPTTPYGTVTQSGGAQFVAGAAGDMLVIYADAFRRDADPDDYSLRAIIAHERGHQVLVRDPRLAGRVAGLPLTAEEVLASLVGVRLVGPGSDRRRWSPRRPATS